MRPREDELIDPEIAEQLDAIDATLAGEPVAPRFAELAELALMLSAVRPEGPSPEFARELDGRVDGRFGRGARAAGDGALAGGGGASSGAAGASSGAAGASSGAAGASSGRGGSGSSSRRRPRWWGAWGMGPMLGAATTAVAAVLVAVAVFTSGGGSSTPKTVYNSSLTPQTKTPATTTAATAAARTTAATSTSAPGASHGFNGKFFAGGPVKAAAPAALPAPERLSAHGSATAGSSASGAVGSGAAPAGSTTAGPTTAGAGSSGAGSVRSSTGGSRAALGPATTAPVHTLPPVLVQAPATAYSTAGTASPAPLPNGRKIVQSSILELGTPAKRIDTVAQEVFEVVRAVNAIVETSNVSSTGGPGASAQFQLRVPSQYLADALTALSKLRYANVISRTDNTQDVNSPYLSLQREITAANATLAKLRLKLAATTDPTEIASFKQQIAAETATLARAQGSFQALNRQVDFSNLYVSLQATTGGGVTPVGGGKGGFGLHQAGHDALRVLEVTAGIALIVLAALVPIGLLAALAWWVAGTVQRRRRERALDLA